MESKPDTIYKIPKEWELLAELDDSADYEVDITAIYKNGEEFILATASGCSCWDGDYDVEYFTTLDALADSVGIFADDREFQPSIKGAEALVKEARETLQKAT